MNALRAAAERLARGAARSPVACDTAVPGGILRGRLPPSSPGVALLDEAATAAFLAATALDLPHPSLAFPVPAERPCGRPLSERTQSALTALLPDSELLIDALAALADRGFVLPLPLVPAVLDAVGPKARDVHGRFVGRLAETPRGRVASRLLADPTVAWLAVQNPEWSWAVPFHTDHEADFVQAPAADRPARMRAWRELAPAAARAHLETIQSGLTAADRAPLVAALAPRVGPEDEPFLETLLDDRSIKVRRESVLALARLESSALAARARTRAFDLIQAQNRMMGLRRVLQIDLPPERSDAETRLKQDGLDAGAELPQGAVVAKVGPRQQALAHAVMLVPPHAWRTHLDWDDNAIVAAFSSHEYHDALIGGWAGSALLHDDTPALEALTGVAGQRRFAPLVVNLLVPELARRGRIDWLVRYLGKNGQDVDVLTAICEIPGPWPDALADAVYERACTVGSTAGRSPYAIWGPLLAAVARAGRPDRHWPPAPSGLSAFVKKWYDQAQAITATRFAFYRSLEET